MKAVTWSRFKSYLNNLLLPHFCLDENEETKTLFCVIAGSVFVECILIKSGDDWTDYSTNYLSKTDKAPQSDPDGVLLVRQRAFSNADNFRFRGFGYSWTATKNQSNNLDYTLPEERFINGVKLVLKDHVFGDTVDFHVVDKSYTYAGILYPATNNGSEWSVSHPNGVVLDDFSTSWNIEEGSQDLVLLPYPARLLSNLTIRIVYHSVGTSSDVLVRANFFLHKRTS